MKTYCSSYVPSGSAKVMLGSGVPTSEKEVLGVFLLHLAASLFIYSKLDSGGHPSSALPVKHSLTSTLYTACGPP